MARKSRASRNLSSWGDFLEIIGIIGIFFGVIVLAMEGAVGLFVLGSALILILAGVFFRAHSVIVEASYRYIQKLDEEAQKGPEVGD